MEDGEIFPYMSRRGGRHKERPYPGTELMRGAEVQLLLLLLLLLAVMLMLMLCHALSMGDTKNGRKRTLQRSETCGFLSCCAWINGEWHDFERQQIRPRVSG
jgi:hypothetical protein